MEPENCGYGWKPARASQLNLIHLWEIVVLKEHFIKGLGLTAGFILLYFLIVVMYYNEMHAEPPVWKALLFLLFTLSIAYSLWGLIIYWEERELWGGNMYTRTVTCIGHTELRTRWRRTTYLDIIGEAGEVLKGIQTPNIIIDVVKHQETLLAVTNDPNAPDPIRLVPLHPPMR